MIVDDRICKQCKKNISHMVGQARFCGRPCYNLFNNQWRIPLRKEQPCEYCKKIFIPKTIKKTKYCSMPCLFAARREQFKVVHEPRECNFCHASYTPTRSLQIYCGPRCRAEMARAAWHGGMSVNDLRTTAPAPTPAPDVVPPGDSLPFCLDCGTKPVQSIDHQQCSDCENKALIAAESAVAEAKAKIQGGLTP